MTAKHDAAIRHYLKGKMQHGSLLDGPELMIRYMLEPPGLNDGALAFSDEVNAEAERAAASIAEIMGPGFGQ